MNYFYKKVKSLLAKIEILLLMIVELCLKKKKAINYISK